MYLQPDALCSNHAVISIKLDDVLHCVLIASFNLVAHHTFDLVLLLFETIQGITEVFNILAYLEGETETDHQYLLAASYLVQTQFISKEIGLDKAKMWHKPYLQVVWLLRAVL